MTTTTTLTGLRAQWDTPFTGDPSDTAASSARSTLTRELAAAILSAPLSDPQAASRTQIGEMFIADAGWWSTEHLDIADATAERGSPEWWAALGAHEHVTLTSDGKAANRRKWCTCPNDDVSADQWVRYEFWTAEGCQRHGFVHSECRRLLQAG